MTDYSVRGKIKTARISNSIISINVSEQLSNNKVAVISFRCKYKVMSPGAKSVAVADGFREEMKHVMRSVPHCVEQCFVSSIGKLLSSGITCTIEAKPDPSVTEILISYRFGVIAVYCSNFGHCILSPPLGGLGTTYDVHLGLTGNRVVDYVLVLIKLFR